MKVVYNATNSLDAHVLLGLLNQAGISANISGEFLQGAMGELPAFDLVKVYVDDADYQQALEIVAAWQNELLA